MTDWQKIISEWGTPAMSVYATELVCTKCHRDMGAVIFAKKKIHQIVSHNQITIICKICFEELKKSVRDSKTPGEGKMMEHLLHSDSCSIEGFSKAVR